MSGLIPLASALLYALLLFAVAAIVDRRSGRAVPPALRLSSYTLALGVYCSSWTFFGTVGSAASDGWHFLAIYVGPIVLFLAAPRLLERLIHAVRDEGATSISDFIGSRFGNSRGVAALVTTLAAFGTIPYIALQLRSVGRTYAEIAGGDPAGPMMLTAIILAVFAILFGTRRYVASGRSDGVLNAVAVESLVKLLALVAVAIFAVVLLSRAPPEIRDTGWRTFAANFRTGQFNLDFLLVSLISMAAIICLPRQFYVTVIGAHEPEDPRKVRWAFAGYLVIVCAVIVPIALAGMTLLSPTQSPDLYVLSLASRNEPLTLLVFLGGFSAATGMVIVETIALSTMISNDLVAPLLLRNRRVSGEGNIGGLMLLVRRLAIGVIVGGALAYALLIPPNQSLASIGLIAFAAMAQFAPALLLALRGKHKNAGDALALQAGLTVGLCLWFYTLFFPAIAEPSLLASLSQGWFDPNNLLGLWGLSPVAHGVVWSLGANLAVFLILSMRKVRAPLQGFRLRTGVGSVANQGQLADLVTRFVGPEAVTEAFGEIGNRMAQIDPRMARIAERLIAGVVGAPSAHAIMASALSGTALKVDDITRLLDQSGQSLQFSRGLLAATLENIDPGVSVIDRDLRLVAWNSRYLDLFAYPPGTVRVGLPVETLIRFNAERGDCGPGEVEDHVARRLGHMRRASRHSFERRRPDGRVIKTVGGPMPGGGYVMCFTDITAEWQARTALEHARAELEKRVEQRTQELRDANLALAQATRDKTRFLAAASHDLLQPMHAARLFLAALARDMDDAHKPLIGNIDRSIDQADALLRTLLDISKLDAGGVSARPEAFALGPFLSGLAETFAPLAAEKGLRLHVHPGRALVEADPTLLRSVVQNLLSNAVRYTSRGGVLIGARKRGGQIRIEVYDTGPGIAPEHQAVIFREFWRLGSGGEAGVGLGLSIVERSARLMGTPLDLRSEPGRGSRFAVSVPIAMSAPVEAPAESRTARPLEGLRIVLIDDETAVREALNRLLLSRGCVPLMAATPQEAEAALPEADAVLVDYDLGADEDGLRLITRWKQTYPHLKAALITAARDGGLEAACREAGAVLMHKPLAPDILLEWLALKTDTPAA